MCNGGITVEQKAQETQVSEMRLSCSRILAKFQAQSQQMQS